MTLGLPSHPRLTWHRVAGEGDVEGSIPGSGSEYLCAELQEGETGLSAPGMEVPWAGTHNSRVGAQNKKGRPGLGCEPGKDAPAQRILGSPGDGADQSSGLGMSEGQEKPDEETGITGGLPAPEGEQQAGIQDPPPGGGS